MDFSPVPRTRVPDPEAPHVRAFCDSLVPGEEPELMDVEVAPGATENDCFHVVERQIADAGGTAVFGWAIWE